MESCCISTRRPSPSAARLRVLHTRKPPAAAPGILFFACSSAKRSERKKMFVFGMGFVGLHVSRKLRQEGWEVSGTCTSEEKKRTLEEMGFDAFVFNDSENDLENLSNLTLSTHLLLSIPPAPNRGDPLLLLEEDLKCKFSGGNLQWLGYLSSTSVYGDCRGAFVDEDYQPEPAIPAARARLAAEQAWINLGCDLGASSYVFRLGGIYGPGRSALDTIIKRESLSKYQKTRESRKYTARIHVDDIYQAITNSFTMSRTRCEGLLMRTPRQWIVIP